MCRPVTQTGNAESRGTEVRCANATFVARGFAQAQLAVWRALYGGLPAGDNSELASAVKTVLDWAATQQKQSLS